MPVSWTYANMRKSAPGAILVVVLFAVTFSLAANKWANDARPIRSVDPVDATVKSLAWDQTKTYALSLEDNSMVFVQDDRPYLLGSHVAIERVTRNDGSVFYRFPE